MDKKIYAVSVGKCGSYTYGIRVICMSKYPENELIIPMGDDTTIGVSYDGFQANLYTSVNTYEVTKQLAKKLCRDYKRRGMETMFKDQVKGEDNATGKLIFVHDQKEYEAAEKYCRGTSYMVMAGGSYREDDVKDCNIIVLDPMTKMIVIDNR